LFLATLASDKNAKTQLPNTDRLTRPTLS